MKAKHVYIVAHGGLYVPVRVIESRKSYGRTDVLVTPIGGKGQAWINSKKILANAVAPELNGSNEATKKAPE